MQLVINRGKHQGTFIPVTGTIFTIGRDPGCQLRPRSDEVSRRHAELKSISGLVTIRDLGSRNGTRVNGQPLTSQRCLRHGDRIEIGPLFLTVLMEETRQVKRTHHPAEEEVAAWLIGDEEPESPLTDFELSVADTAESEVAPGASEGIRDLRTNHSLVAAADEALDLLRSMSATGSTTD